MMVAMLAAAILVPVQGGFDPFFPWSALVAGAGWVLSGTITLFVYLCHHHVAAVEQ
jgi:hypothetical protein